MNKEGIALNKQQNTPEISNPASGGSREANELWCLSTYNSETSKNQRSYIENVQNSGDGEQLQPPAQFSYGKDEDNEDDDDSACFEENIRKMLKFDAESCQKIPQHQKSTEKSSPPSSRIPDSESSIQQYKATLGEQKIYTNSEIELMFSNFEYAHLLSANKSRLEINVQKAHPVIEMIPNKEAKNFLKLYGNFFMDYLRKENLIDESFGKDCLCSLIIWNYVLNGGNKKAYKDKKISQFLSKLDNLTNRNWRLPFLKFVSTFDFRKIRTAKLKSKYPEKKLIYELLARLLKIAAEIILSRFQETSAIDISTLSLEEVSEDKIIIRFSFVELSKEALNPQEFVENQVVQPNTETTTRRSNDSVPEFSSSEEEEKTSQVNMLNDVDEGINMFEDSDRLFSYTDTRLQIGLMEAEHSEQEHSEAERGKDNENNPQNDFILYPENVFREMWLEIKETLERHEQMLLGGARGLEEEQPEDLSQDHLLRINNN